MQKALEAGTTNLNCHSSFLVLDGSSLSPFFKGFLMPIVLVKHCSGLCFLEMKQRTITVQCHYTVK